VPHFIALAGVIPANIVINDILYILWSTLLPQKVSVYLQPLLRNPPRKLPNSVKLSIGLLRRSRSFKVTDFGTNRKLICDFLLVINRLGFKTRVSNTKIKTKTCLSKTKTKTKTQQFQDQDQDQDSAVPRPRPRPRHSSSKKRPRPRHSSSKTKTKTKTLMSKTKTETQDLQDKCWKSMTGMDCDKQKD